MNHKEILKKVVATAIILAAVGSGVMFAARHASSGQAQDGSMHVVASYYPLYEFARQVGKEKVTVIDMTPAGSEPHEYEPSAKALADAADAPVFIYNGVGMEPWAQDFVKNYKGTAVKASAHISLLHIADEGDSSREISDPHFWLDPALAGQIVDNIAHGLGAADPANASYYLQNAAAYKTQLTQLDNDFKSGLTHCRLRQVVASHDAFTYIAKRYNFTVLPIAGLSPDDEPSPARLAALSNLVKEQNITYVFFERLASSRLADTIATETGAKTLVFDPIEGLSNADQNQGKNYLSVQRENLQNLRTALACQ